MAVNFAPKQTQFLNRWSAAVSIFLADADALNALCAEYAANSYGQGGTNEITDATAQSVLPAATALLVAQAEGAIAGANGVLSVITANRGYLEMMRP